MKNRLRWGTRGFLVAAMSIGSFAIMSAPASAGVVDPPCVRYAWDVPNDYQGSRDNLLSVFLNSSGDDAVSANAAMNGHYSGTCLNYVNGWTAESLTAMYYWNGVDWVLCGGAQPYQYATSTTGKAFVMAYGDGGQYYRSGNSARVWFAGVPMDSGIAYTYANW